MEIVKNRISRSIRQKYECKRQKIVWNLYVTAEKVNFEIKCHVYVTAEKVNFEIKCRTFPCA